MDKHCLDCVYCKRMNGGDSYYCAYIFINDRRRPCPPGDGCKAKVSIKTNRRKRAKQQ